MTLHRSDFRNQYSHPDIYVNIDDAFSSMSRWLLDYFSNAIRDGIKFKHEETVQFGWSLILLKEDVSGDLEIQEPDFCSMPIVWVSGANNTLRQLTLQREVCAQLDLTPEFPSLRQSGIIPPGFLNSSSGFEMVRDAASGNDSGWVFYNEARDGIKAEHCSLFQISLTHKAIIPFLALPPETCATYSTSNINILSNKKKVSSEDNKFLAELIRYFAVN